MMIPSEEEDTSTVNNGGPHRSNNNASHLPQLQMQTQMMQSQMMQSHDQNQSTSSQINNSPNDSRIDPSPPPPLPPPSSSSVTAYHPSFMFCGSCTGCEENTITTYSGTDTTSAIQSLSMLPSFPKKKKKRITQKMVFVNDFTDITDNMDENDNNTNDDSNHDIERGIDNDDNILTVTSDVSFEKLDPSQRLLLKKVLDGMEHVHSFKIRNITNPSSDNDDDCDNYNINKNNNSNVHPIRSYSYENDDTYLNHLVSIEYNPRIVSITKILESLHDLGLKNTIQHTSKMTIAKTMVTRNNNNNISTTVLQKSNQQQQQETTSSPKCRSSFYVDGICCASEVPIVTSIIKTIPMKKQYIKKVSINITSRMVYVEYNPEFVTAFDIHNALVQEGFEKSTIEQDGNVLFEKRKMKSMKKSVDIRNEEDGKHVFSVENKSSLLEHHSGNRKDSNFVESVLFVPQLSEDAIDIMHEIFYVNDLLFDYIRTYSPNIASHTVKIEHNPKLSSIQNIVDTLIDDDTGKEFFEKCDILVDGQQEGLILPPLNNGNNLNHVDNHDGKDMRSTLVSEMAPLPSSRRFYIKYFPCFRSCGIGTPNGLSLSIVLSGLFWFVSIFGHFYDNHILQIMGLFSVFFGLPPVAKKAFRTLRRRQFDANCMMVTAAVGAVALQEFDEAASVSFLFAISEYLEDRATRKARKALDDIIHLRPDYANLIDTDSGEITIVPVNDLDLGDLVSVRMGDKIPTDGVVVEGYSQIDEASLTGESRPINKGAGDVVAGGTINVGNTRLVIRATALVEDSAVSRLIRLVEESASSRSQTEQLVDAFARSYTPTVIFIAFLLCTIPWYWGSEIGKHWTLNGLIIIVIACPCALTISTPVTYAAGLAATAQNGIIVKGGAKLEALGKVKKIVFDKTGTLTEGKFRLVDLQLVGHKRTRREVLELLAIMEGPSSHPLAATLVNAAKEEGVISSNHVSVVDHSILRGEGVTAIVNDKRSYVGNVRLFQRLGMYDNLVNEERDKVKKWNDLGSTVGLIGIEGIGIIGIFCVADAVRPEAKEVVQALITDGIEIYMLTGDGTGPAHAVASEVGIPDDYVQSQFLPEDKLHYVASMLSSSKKGSMLKAPELLMMCGDGVNDAPALAVADVGVAMGDGAALALEISDVTLMDSNLSKLLFSIKIGMKVIVTVQENIAVSVAAKVAVIVLTFMGKMSLLGAIASDVGVMLLVSINGMKLLPGGSGLLCCKTRRPRYKKVDWQQPINDIV